MSKYTTQVRFICESLCKLDESVGVQDVNNVVKVAYTKIFDNFPIYDESHREELCCKILRHYYTREIGSETFGLWKLRLNNVLNEVMPYYNELYKSCDIEYNPLYNREVVVDYEGNDTGENTGSSSAKGKAVNKYSDTPQNGLSEVDNDRYLTNARIVNDETESKGTTKYDNKTKTKQTVKGKEGDRSYSSMIIEYRNAILNVDKMIIDELSDCFMNIF